MFLSNNRSRLLLWFVIFFSVFSWTYSKAQDVLFNESDEQSIQTIEHTLWQDILTAYLHDQPDGQLRLFDYNHVRKSDRIKLQSYLEMMKAIDPKQFNKAEQKAYWINLYNALTINLVLENYPVKSITKIGPFYRFGPWDQLIATIAGKRLTLNDIEHRILLKNWSDKRIHYALNCASKGCPDLSTKAFTTRNTDEQLEQLARRFVNQTKAVRFENKKLILSKIYRWYAKDFGDRARLLKHLRYYLSLESARLLLNFSGTIDYQYNWDLNDGQPLLKKKPI